MARVAPGKESPVVMGIYLITFVPLESVSILMMEMEVLTIEMSGADDSIWRRI